MATAPEGAAPEEIKNRLDAGQDIKPPRCPQLKSNAAQRLNRLAARLDALATRKEDLERRIADVDARLWEPNWFFCRVYQDEVDDLTDAVTAWRLAAASVVLDLGRSDSIMRRAA